MQNRTITAVPGCEAGHATHTDGSTGVTVLLFPESAGCGVFVAGHATGTRELGALSPLHITDRIHGLCLSGGSVFGLGAADGLVRELVKRDIGVDTGYGKTPIVPAAILFDLDCSTARPNADLGAVAAQAANTNPLKEGRIGAAAGARVARITGDPQPSGFGTWAEKYNEFTVAAGVAVNSLGSIHDSNGRFAGGRIATDQFEFESFPFSNTTLAIAITDIPMTRPQLTIAARMASAAIARTHWPAFTPFDGDIVFAVSTAPSEQAGMKELTEVGHLMALCLQKAIMRAVKKE